MSQNYKGFLQELAQKYGFLDPEYVTTKSGSDHNPNFVSTVTVNEESFTGEICKTKKASEAMAACEAINYLNDIKNMVSVDKKCILINSDYLEMINNEITIKELSDCNLDIYIFTNKEDVFVNQKLPIKINKIISPSILPNSKDICMMTYTGSLLAKNLYDIYFIATYDEFSSVLVEMIKDKNFGWNNKEVHKITKIDQIYAFDKKLKNKNNY